MCRFVCLIVFVSFTVFHTVVSLQRWRPIPLRPRLLRPIPPRPVDSTVVAPRQTIAAFTNQFPLRPERRPFTLIGGTVAGTASDPGLPTASSVASSVSLNNEPWRSALQESIPITVVAPRTSTTTSADVLLWVSPTVLARSLAPTGSFPMVSGEGNAPTIAFSRSVSPEFYDPGIPEKAPTLEYPRPARPLPFYDPEQAHTLQAGDYTWRLQAPPWGGGNIQELPLLRGPDVLPLGGQGSGTMTVDVPYSTIGEAADPLGRPSGVATYAGPPFPNLVPRLWETIEIDPPSGVIPSASPSGTQSFQTPSSTRGIALPSSTASTVGKQ